MAPDIVPSRSSGDSLARPRRSSALEEIPTLIPPTGFPGLPVTRRSSAASRTTTADDDLANLARTASAISNTSAARSLHHLPAGSAQNQQPREQQQQVPGSLDQLKDLPAFAMLQPPCAAKKGPASTIREVPSSGPTPASTRPPSPTLLSWPGGDGELGRGEMPWTGLGGRSPLSRKCSEAEYGLGTGRSHPDVGRIRSWRGALILICTCGAQMMDNIFMTSVNIALPAIQRDFSVPNGDLQWLISAYTLTFGGFLLLAGAVADRYGRRPVFCGGMALLTAWTLAAALSSSFVQLAVFRALQGVGAAMTVPSAIGVISSYFAARDRTLALTMFGAAGAVGFCVGLVFGGFLTASLGWRYVFYVAVAVTATVALASWWVLPRDNKDNYDEDNDEDDGNEKKGDSSDGKRRPTPRPRLDIWGALLSTAGLILLSFVLSSGGEYGWGKAFIITLLVLSVALLASFIIVEMKVANPIMPLSLWKLQNFTALWIGGFVMYGGYQTTVYYTTLIAQEVNKLSASQAALRFLPMGCTGFIFSMSMSFLLDRVNTKLLLVIGMAVCVVAPVPSALIRSAGGATAGDLDFWRHVFPTTVMGVAGTTIVYCTITVVLLQSVPANVKSLCGGMINTAFQIGSGVGLAVTSAVVQAVDTSKGHGLVEQYSTGLWCCVGMAGIGLVASTLGVRNVGKASGLGKEPVH